MSKKAPDPGFGSATLLRSKMMDFFLEYSSESGPTDGLPEGVRPRGVRDVQGGARCQRGAGQERDPRPDHRRRVGLRQGTQEDRQEASQLAEIIIRLKTMI